MQASGPNFKLIIGLGNPGPKYENTYHNVGARFAKYLNGIVNNLRLIPWRLAIPTIETYVNESGKFVLKMLKKEGVDPKHLLIVQDDSDLEIGKYKFTEPGHSAAGHHGIESIQAVIKTNDFWRLRIGIRPSPAVASAKEGHRLKAGEFVLKKISLAHQKLLLEVFEKAALEIQR